MRALGDVLQKSQVEIVGDGVPLAVLLQLAAASRRQHATLTLGNNDDDTQSPKTTTTTTKARAPRGRAATMRTTRLVMSAVKLPESCRIHVCHTSRKVTLDYPGELLRCPNVAEQLSDNCVGSRTSAKNRSTFSELGHRKANIDKNRPTSANNGPNGWSTFGRCRTMFGKDRPTSGQTRHELKTCGRVWPNLGQMVAQVGTRWSILASLWPLSLAHNGPTLRTPVDVGPNLGSRSNFATTVGQLLGNLGTTSELAGIAKSRQIWSNSG